MPTINRRDFVKTAAAATSYLALDAPGFAQTARKRRYAIVGTGDRGTGMWGRPVAAGYADVLEFVGLCDPNGKRAEVSRQMIGVSCPTFTNFDEMCTKAKPDLLTVTTVDAFHAEHIVKALDRGIDVITEKPMVIDEVQCKAVLDAEKRNNRKIGVTFNYRYAPKHRTIKETLMAGEIGKVISVDFHWYLDVYHGADYFRRWHRLRIEGGQPVGAQGHPPLRSHQLVAGRGSGRGVGEREPERVRQERAVPVHQLPAVPAQVQVPVPLRHHDQREPDEAVRRVRGRRRLPPRRLRVQRGRRHLRQHVGAREGTRTARR